ncbi:MAG TPA: hypothetical protein VLA59_07225, partial [Patescibacteria group bacterium]|nr:hypothetical protein [Patescibacteria group bacterium]
MDEMTANQRRPGFRLPWSSEEEGEAGRPNDTTTPEEPSLDAPPAESSSDSTQPTATETATEPAAPVAPPAPATTPDVEPPEEFLRELVAAMRRVADETKQAGLADARARAEERVKQLEADGERRRQELSTRAEADIAAVGEWAKAEAERIKAEAERR